MATIQIIDTGYLQTGSVSGTQATRANSGNALSLKVQDITYERAGNVDDTPIINTNSGPIIGFGSVSASVITAKCYVKRADISDLTVLSDMIGTYGIKLLYYSSVSDGYNTLLKIGGEAQKDDVHKAAFFSGTATPHLHVKLTNLQITQTTTDKVEYTLEMVETA